MSKESILQEAITTGEVLRIRYDGGSQPGTERDISPISLKGGKVRARCYSSNAVKLFVIEKITVLDQHTSSNNDWEQGLAKRPRHESLNDLALEMNEELKTEGWHIEQSDDHIGLHMYGKHKKLLKYPTVSIYYDPEINELHMDLDGNFTKPDRKREKPWVVSAKGHNTSSFKNFEKAALRFIDVARQIKPNPAPDPRSI